MQITSTSTIQAAIHDPSFNLEPRPRLGARLRRSLAGRLTIVAAAPGYGKTLALTRAARADGRPAIDYRAVPGDRGARLVHRLAESLGVGTPPAPGPQLSLRDSLEALVSAAPTPRLLLLDDLHRFDAALLGHLLSFLTTGLPPGWHAVITTNRDLTQPEIARLLCCGDADRLDERDLAFDQDEARAVLASLGRPAVDPDQTWRRALGWPLGVVAIAQGREALLPDYFCRAVLARLRPDLREFLDATVVLESLTPEACQTVTGREDAPKLLEEVLASHLFVIRQPDGRLAFHPLFRAAILEQLNRRKRSQLVRSYRQASDYALAQGDLGTAFLAACAAGDYSRAIDLLRTAAPRLVAAGRGAELSEWITRFPASMTTSDPWLLHYRAIALRLTSVEPEALTRARQMQEQARDAFAARGDCGGAAHALAELGMLACLLRRPAEAQRLLEEARARLDEADASLQAALLASLAEAYVALNRLDDAIRAGEAALALPRQGADVEIARAQVRALQAMALALIREGKLARALELASQAITLGRAYPLDPPTQVLAQYLLGLVHQAKGDLKRALDLTAEAAAQADAHGLRSVARSITATRAELLTHLGRLDEAEVLFRQAGNPTGHLGDVGYLRFRQERLAEAQAIFQEQLQDALRTGREADAARARWALGAVLLRMGRFAEAERLLVEAARACERAGARGRYAGVSLYLAYLYLLKGDSYRCRSYLRLVLDYACKTQVYTFFLWHPDVIAPLAARALREKLHSEYVEALCTCRLAAPQVRYFLPLLADHDPEISGPAGRIARTLIARDDGSLALAELEACRDEPIRARLAAALADGRLTLYGLLVLRHQYGLTWAEIDVFVAYYLTPAEPDGGDADLDRRAVARRLGLSENTLMHHVTSLRHKLGFGARKGSAAVLLWALVAEVTRIAALRERGSA